MDAINHEFGAGSITSFTDGPILNIPAISTGAVTLDAALGVWGVPKGRIIEIYGPESSGKTTLALSIIHMAQKAGGTAAFVDAEHGLDPAWAENIGVNMQDLMLSQPDSGDEALSIVERLITSGLVDIVVVDSVAALIPQSEIDGEMGDQQMGAQARLMSQAMRKLVAIVHKSKCVVIFINQIRFKIGVMFGNPETTPGGNALKFYASVRLDIRRKDSIKDGETVIGNAVKVKVIKNKVAPPFKSAEFNIYYGMNGHYGVDYASSLVECGLERKVLDRKGTWISFNDIRLGGGAEAAYKFVRETPDIAAKIEELIRATYHAKPIKELDNQQGPSIELTEEEA